MTLATAERIAVVGIGGSGKSTIAREIEKLTQLPLIHMDTLFWRGAWEEIPESEYLPKHAKLISEGKWIIEGYIDESMADRARRADLIIWLDYSGLRCFVRVIIRWLKHRNLSRDEYPPEAVEQFIPHFFMTVLFRRERPAIVEALKDIPESRIIRVTSPSALTAALS